MLIQTVTIIAGGVSIALSNVGMVLLLCLVLFFKSVVLQATVKLMLLIKIFTEINRESYVQALEMWVEYVFY